jgi:hypothetical protein
MFPVSGRFLDAIRGGQYIWVVQADVYYSNDYITTVPLTGGSITIDRTAHVKRSCTVTVGDPSFIPLFTASALSPYGSELRIYAGIRYPSQDTEMIPLGIYTIYSITWDESEGSLPQVTGYDYGKKIDDAVLAHAVDRGGFDAINLLAALIQNEVEADLVIDESLLTYTLPGGTSMDGNRWDCIQQVLDPMGAEGFFDVHGNFIVQPVPQVTSETTDEDVDWTVDAGEGGVLVSAQHTITREGVYNFVTATGTSTSDTGDPPIGYAADTNPTSPTFWGPASSVPNGPFIFTPFGDVVLRYENTNMTTNSQCTLAAKAQLAQFIGVNKSLDLSAAPNIGLDAGDIIKVVLPDGRFEYHLIDNINLSLGGDSFTMQTRSTIGTLLTD